MKNIFLVFSAMFISLALQGADNDRPCLEIDNDIVRILDAKTNHLLHVLQGHKGSVNAASFNKEKTEVVSAGTDSTVHVWSALTGQLLHILRGHDGPVKNAWFNDARFNKEKRLIISVTDHTVHTWDAKTGQLLHITPKAPHKNDYIRTPNGNLQSKDGTIIVSACNDNTVRIWELEPKSNL